jgi:hypothetical protein
MLKFQKTCEAWWRASNNANKWKLKKGLHGLKQAGRVWNKTLTKHLRKLGLNQSKHDNSLFFSTEAGRVIYLLTYVDDFLVVTIEPKLADTIINGLQHVLWT